MPECGSDRIYSIYSSFQMMTTVRDFLVAHLGGSTFMWDVFLGVVLALLVMLILRLLIWIVSYPFR